MRAGDHFSRTQVALGLEQPTRKLVRDGSPRVALGGRSSSCLALLPMGFAEPDRSPGLLVSSYLTVSPLPTGRTSPAVCSLWHCPWPRGRWALPTIEPCGARTFLPPPVAGAAEAAPGCRGRRSPGPLQSVWILHARQRAERRRATSRTGGTTRGLSASTAVRTLIVGVVAAATKMNDHGGWGVENGGWHPLAARSRRKHPFRTPQDPHTCMANFCL